MIEKSHSVDDVFGVSRDLPLNYVARTEVDQKFIDSLSRSQHIVIYGSSKQGKTSLRKHCLIPDDYVVVSCSNRWTLIELHTAILKAAGYVTKQSTSKTVSGNAKLVASLEGKTGIPLVAQVKASGNSAVSGSISETNNMEALELDPLDTNDIIRALEDVNFRKFFVLEDFHYLPEETQRDFCFSLKSFHENSKFCFIVVGVWREQNRLISYNGDLTDRVFSVDVDTWNAGSLNEVIDAGSAFLNIDFDKTFREELTRSSFNSVHIVQEVCRRCCKAQEIYYTCNKITTIGENQSAKELIKLVVDDQTARYRGFLQNFSDGFQQTDLEMPKWIISGLLTFSIDELEDGIRLRELSRRIKAGHPRKENLNNGNITQTLNSASSLQTQKNIRPIVIDYDAANRNLHVVDKGFLIWLASQDVSELLEDLSLPDLSKDIIVQSKLEL